ncbi:hypothetical protein COOONC_25380, partial [Cooperia oncophora]
GHGGPGSVLGQHGGPGSVLGPGSIMGPSSIVGPNSLLGPSSMIGGSHQGHSGRANSSTDLLWKNFASEGEIVDDWALNFCDEKVVDDFGNDVYHNIH